MEFENANNYNLYLEAQAKRATHKKIFSSAARFIKKLVRRAKRDCICTSMPPRSEEEIDNDLNEQLEAKMRMPQEADLRTFHHVTFYQIPSAQVPYS